MTYSIEYVDLKQCMIYYNLHFLYFQYYTFPRKLLVILEIYLLSDNLRLLLDR